MSISNHATRRDFLGTTATGLLALTTVTTVIAAERADGSDLQRLGRLWQLNLEHQQQANVACDRAASECAAREANERFEHLVDEGCELADAIGDELAHTREELAIKARVVLREIATFGDAGDIAASLSRDLIRLAEI